MSSIKLSKSRMEQSGTFPDRPRLVKKPEIPTAFLETMRLLLLDEFPAFQAIYTQEPVTGLRFNTLKASPQQLIARLPWQLEPLPWSSSGFLIQESTPELVSPGKTPEHAAGLFYLQDPAAMIAAELLQAQPGERVLDLCAAPGGKTTHLASQMQQRGLLWANEIHSQRVWELAENLERWGVHNVVITNDSPVRLAQHLPGFFDKILVDAPCSGEGMFRKSEAARRDWNPALVASCALRQVDILKSAIQLLKPGGRLVYSTCTFNPHENESVISRLLDQELDLKIVKLPGLAVTSPGRPDWVSLSPSRPELAQANRLWPHLAPGEGHFAILLEKSPHARTAQPPEPSPPEVNLVWTKAARNVFQRFCDLNLYLDRQPGWLDWEQLSLQGAYLYLLPKFSLEYSKIKVIHPGWWLGSFHSGKVRSELRFQPAHALAMGLTPNEVRLVLKIPTYDPSIQAYLRGELLPWSGEDGWVLICLDDYPLGWGKAVAGRIKNYYPRGLRRP